MDRQWVPEDVDINTPSAARVYDALLGGGHNFPSDRAFAREAERVYPGLGTSARANRAFLRRAVLHALDAGVRQFLDLGSGIPTVGNVHEIVHAVDPTCPVVYVDYEPVAVAHSDLLLKENRHATIVAADARDAQHVLAHPETTRLLNFDEPVMVLMLALLHFIPDEDRPADIVASYREPLAAGSMIAITSAANDARQDELAELTKLFASSSNPAVPRPKAWIAEQFGDFELVEPGAQLVGDWRPDERLDDEQQDHIVFGGVGVRR
ncbi:SAM-dependent methyltransferase [Saccharopolyspora sp. HNM0986]|uniref:SAM-dependent methyltransferase n=1 Tax=Saccharopolyspora galaxeae TaxID=2781241 RepID=UPI00190A5F0D|nr:SAM-dependent methyltransferase [Saccharopolyspora sp. HNM0986]MBK0870299.1 SAM-dependent methyltransferase [Saccharopolyspora sp. HNM0986]